MDRLFGAFTLGDALDQVFGPGAGQGTVQSQQSPPSAQQPTNQQPAAQQQGISPALRQATRDPARQD